MWLRNSKIENRSSSKARSCYAFVCLGRRVSDRIHWLGKDLWSLVTCADTLPPLTAHKSRPLQQISKKFKCSKKEEKIALQPLLTSQTYGASSGRAASGNPLALSTDMDTLGRGGFVLMVAPHACAHARLAMPRLASHLIESIPRICQHLLPSFQQESLQYRPHPNALLFPSPPPPYSKQSVKCKSYMEGWLRDEGRKEC